MSVQLLIRALLATALVAGICVLLRFTAIRRGWFFVPRVWLGAILCFIFQIIIGWGDY